MTSRMRSSKSLFILPLLLATVPVTHAGTTVSDVRVRGDTITAIFSSIDPLNPCPQTFASVLSADSIEKTTSTGMILVFKTTLAVSEFDICVGDILFIGEGNTSTHTLFVASNLTSAEVTATVPVVDQLSGSVSTFSVSMAWKAITRATITNTVDSFKDKDLGVKVKTVSHSTAAEAIATGEVYGIGTNFTPLPSDSATIQRFNEGTHTIEKTF
jgi:hypothetical protein